MSEIDQVRNDLVIANRVLALENVVDAYGHVSVRHPTRPDRFLLSRSRSPQLVDASDILEFTLDGKVVGDDNRSPYLERFIHAAVYEARPEITAVIHAHAEDILPFSISKTTRLQAVIGSGSGLGHEIPIWDIREKFGEATNLLVSEHGPRPRPGAPSRRQYRLPDARPRFCRGGIVPSGRGAHGRVFAAQC